MLASVATVLHRNKEMEGCMKRGSFEPLPSDADDDDSPDGNSHPGVKEDRVRTIHGTSPGRKESGGKSPPRWRQ